MDLIDLVIIEIERQSFLMILVSSSLDIGNFFIRTDSTALSTTFSVVNSMPFSRKRSPTVEYAQAVQL